MTQATDRAAYGMAEAAELLGVSRGFLYKLEDRGELRVVRLGRRALIPADEIRRLVGAESSTNDSETS